MQPESTLEGQADHLVVQYLTDAGMQILARRWRCGCGEISLIARDAHITAFVHVRTRTRKSFQVPANAITFRKQQRLRRTALLWLARQPEPWHRIRFDLASVVLAPDQEPEIEYFQSVF
ncbi:YraN family protein [Nocardia sp. NPDC049149]|uniref:YraN family protein n=1 Tax=Nocardia sp. NPDC049149 TaxID=3364315 RepID=UPI003710067A